MSIRSRCGARELESNAAVMKPENLLNGLRAACTTIKRKFQILRIGLVRTSLFNRLTRTRRITAIR